MICVRALSYEVLYVICSGNRINWISNEIHTYSTDLKHGPELGLLNVRLEKWITCEWYVAYN